MFLPNDFADKNAVVPNFSLVNRSSLDKILKAEVFIHSDGQLRVAHLILGYASISKSFQAPKCVIKAKDPHLHLINIAMPGFLNPILQYKAEDKATPSQPVAKGEEEDEKVVEELDSEEDFEVFNRPKSPEALTSDFRGPQRPSPGVPTCTLALVLDGAPLLVDTSIKNFQ